MRRKCAEDVVQTRCDANGRTAKNTIAKNQTLQQSDIE
jgi:hypothetical protein